MLRVLASLPSTTVVGFSRYRAKVLLFYLLWIYAPSYPSRNEAILPSSPHLSPTCTASASNLFPRSSAPLAVVQPGLPLGATPFSNDADADVALPSPLTAAYLSRASHASASAAANSAPSLPVAADHMPARGSTSHDSRASNDSGPTPPLSEQPAAVSASADDLDARPRRAAGPGAARDVHVVLSDDVAPRRPRPRREEPVADSPICSTALPAPTSPRLTPLTYTLLALHLLFLLELVFLNLETSPAMSNLSSTRPSLSPLSSLTTPPVRASKGATSSSSLAKRLARARWRISTTWNACGQELVVWAAAALVLGAVGATWRSGGGEGWNAVLGPQAWTAHLRLAEGDEGSSEGAKGWRIMRNVVALEVAVVVLGLGQSVLPLLVAVGLVPSAVPVPSYLEPPPTSPSTPLNSLKPSSRPPTFTIPLLDLAQQYLHPSLAFLVSTLQLAQLALARPPSHSLVNWRTLVWLHAAWCAFDGARRSKARMTSLVAHVRELARAFPGPERGTGEDWRCSICFEGRGEVTACEGAAACVGGAAAGLAADEPRRRVIGFRTLCTLPCRHSFHAHCLVRWFRRVAFCPACHRDARTSSGPAPTSAHEEALRALREARLRAPAGTAAAWAQGAPASEDEFPGARAAAAREGRRARTVDLDGLAAALEAVAMGGAGQGEGEVVEARARVQPSDLPEVAD
ncbi:hypothetical protein JCM3775_006278 [Rhodotorula graminis]